MKVVECAGNCSVVRFDPILLVESYLKFFPSKSLLSRKEKFYDSLLDISHLILPL